MFLLCNTKMKNAHERKRDKTTSLEAHSFWQRVRGKLPRYYFSLSWREAEAGKKRGEGGGGLRGVCVSRSAWDSLARRWEEHVVLILSMGGLEHSVQHWHSVSGKEKKKQWTLKMKTLWLVSHSSPHLFIHQACACETGCVWICRWTQTHTHTHVHRPHAPNEPNMRGLVWINQYTSQWKCVKLRKHCFTQDINSSTITSGDTPPLTVKSNTTPQTCTITPLSYIHREGDFHGNVICIISTYMVQVIRRKG